MDLLGPNPLTRSFQRHLRAENRSARTIATYLIAVRQGDTFLRERGASLEAATRADLEPFLAGLLARRRASTAATYHKVLEILYGWLAEEQEIPANPMAKIKWPIVPEQPVPIVPEEALKRLFQDQARPRRYAAYLVLNRCIRASERRPPVDGRTPAGRRGRRSRPRPWRRPPSRA
jgi:site-specific recombinase XerD